MSNQLPDVTVEVVDFPTIRINIDTGETFLVDQESGSTLTVSGLGAVVYFKDRAEAAANEAIDANIQAQAAADQTAEDRLQTGADRAVTEQNAIDTAADRVQTGLDAQATADDREAVELATDQVAADRIQTGLDAASTAEDRLATAADRVQAGLHAQATAADRQAVFDDREIVEQHVANLFEMAPLVHTHPISDVVGLQSNLDVLAQGVADAAAGEHVHQMEDVIGLEAELNTKLDAAAYTAEDVLEKLKTVDGTGSGLDADQLDGKHATAFVRTDSNSSIAANTTWNDNRRVIFGGHGDMTLFHEAGENHIRLNSGDLHIQDAAEDRVVIERTTGNLTTVGEVTAEGFIGDGSQLTGLSAAQVGLENASNTSDADKPISALQQAALDLKINFADIINNRNSTSTQKPLAAVQGKILQDQIDAINTLLTSDESSLDTIQELVDFIMANKDLLDSLGIANVSGLQAALDAKAALVHTHATSEVIGLDAALANKVETTDPRMSDSREWSANTVSQAGAEAGISNTRAAFSPLRVRQAIVAWWNGTSEKSKLDGIEEGAQVNVGDEFSVSGDYEELRARATTQADVGLANVNNTSDANKPISTATATALAGKAPIVHTHNIADVNSLQSVLDSKEQLLGSGTTTQYLRGDKTWGTPPDTTYSEIPEAEMLDGVATGKRLVSGRRIKFLMDSMVQPLIDLKANLLHGHTVADVAGLQGELDDKVNLDDARLTNAREWSATTVSQAQAEEGTANIRHAWTAQRVRQAIVAWWTGSSDKAKLDTIEPGAQANVGDVYDDTATQAAIASKQPLIVALTCDTVKPTTNKVITAPGYTPQVNDILAVTFTAGNTAATTRLDINDTGPLPVTIRGANATAVASTVAAGGMLLLYFTGTAYQMFGSQRNNDSNTSYSLMSLAELEAGTATNARSISAERLKQFRDAIMEDVEAVSLGEHTHPISEVVGLQAALDALDPNAANYVSKDGDTVTGELIVNGEIGVNTTPRAAMEIRNTSTGSGDLPGGLNSSAVGLLIVSDNSGPNSRPGIAQFGMRTPGSQVTMLNTACIGSDEDNLITAFQMGVYSTVGAEDVDHTVHYSFIDSSGGGYNGANFKQTPNGNIGIGLSGTDIPTQKLHVNGNILATGTVTGTSFIGSVTGNASTATKLAAARTISMVGDVTGSIGFDGSTNVTLTAVVVDNSHNHTIANITGLEAALIDKVDTDDLRLADAREWTASIPSQSEAETGTATTRRAWTAQRVRQAVSGWWIGSPAYDKLNGIEAGAQKNVGDVFDADGEYPDLRAQGTTKEDVGLSDVDNTADLAKPISNATQTALNAKLNVSDVVNTLTSAAVNKPLSANQGMVLKGHIDAINALLASDESTLDSLQEVVDYITTNRNELESLGIANVAGLQAALDGKTDTTDPRLSDAREWTASMVGLAEAEAGSATNRRVWSAERVRQAITAWWNQSAEKTKLDGIEAGAQANVGDVFNAAANTAALAGKVNTDDVRLSDAREWTADTISQGNAEAGTSTVRTAWNALRVRQAIVAWWNQSSAKTKLDGIEEGAQVNTVTSVAGKTGAVTLTKGNVGLGAVDNTADADKPVSTAVQTALNGKANTSHDHAVGDVTGLQAALNAKQDSLGSGTTTEYLRGDGTWATPPNTNTTYSEISTAEIDAGSSSSLRTITGRRMGYVLGTKVSGMITDAIAPLAATTYVDAQVGAKIDTTEIGVSVQPYSAVLENTTASFTSALLTKLNGIQAGAQANVGDVYDEDAVLALIGAKQDSIGSGTTAQFLRGDGVWATPANTTYSVISQADILAGTSTSSRVISAQRLKYFLDSLVQPLVDAKANTTHDHAIADVTGLQSALNDKVDVVVGKGLSTEDYTTGEKSKLAGIAAGAQVNAVTAVAGKTGSVSLVKADVGLGNVDNTTDANKPISTATQTALDAKAPLASANSWTAAQTTVATRATVNAVAAEDISWAADYHTKEITANTTFTFSNVPAGVGAIIILKLTVTGSVVPTWPASVKWPDDTEPTFTEDKTHLVIFTTDDGGTVVRGAALMNYGA